MLAGRIVSRVRAPAGITVESGANPEDMLEVALNHLTALGQWHTRRTGMPIQSGRPTGTVLERRENDLEGQSGDHEAVDL